VQSELAENGKSEDGLPAATTQMFGFNAVHELIRGRGLRFADFWFTDLAGRPWRICVPAEAVTEELFRDGLPLDGQPIGDSWEGVMLLLPEVQSVYPDPGASVPTLAMICDIVDPASKEPLPLEPRHVLRRAERLCVERLGATVALGVEPEFLLQEASGAPAEEGLVREFLRDLAAALGGAGVRVDWFRTGPELGQGRVQMRAGPPTQAADRVLVYRHLAASLARGRKLRATFLPRPGVGGATPGMPVHHALWRNGSNLFHDESGWALSSPLCRWYAGGLLAHLPALLAFCAPTANSYRRLIPGVSGPTESALSTTARSAACRIPTRSASPGARRVKFCPPDGMANPYLAFAAMILAGLDGVQRQLEPPLAEERGSRRGGAFPQSLEAALDALSADRDFLTKDGVFTDRLIDAWVKDRWERHVVPGRSIPHPWELRHLDPCGGERQ
jgi:glutamine synthetase